MFPPSLLRGVTIRARNMVLLTAVLRVFVVALQELTKSMSVFGFDILQALVNDIAPASKVGPQNLTHIRQPFPIH